MGLRVNFEILTLIWEKRKAWKIKSESSSCIQTTDSITDQTEFPNTQPPRVPFTFTPLGHRAPGSSSQQLLNRGWKLQPLPVTTPSTAPSRGLGGRFTRRGVALHRRKTAFQASINQQLTSPCYGVEVLGHSVPLGSVVRRGPWPRQSCDSPWGTPCWRGVHSVQRMRKPLLTLRSGGPVSQVVGSKNGGVSLAGFLEKGCLALNSMDLCNGVQRSWEASGKTPRCQWLLSPGR